MGPNIHNKLGRSGFVVHFHLMFSSLLIFFTRLLFVTFYFVFQECLLCGCLTHVCLNVPLLFIKMAFLFFMEEKFLQQHVLKETHKYAAKTSSLLLVCCGLTQCAFNCVVPIMKHIFVKARHVRLEEVLFSWWRIETVTYIISGGMLTCLSHLFLIYSWFIPVFLSF